MAAAPSAAAGLVRAPAPRPRTSARGSAADWPLVDRICLGLCWAAGLALCLIAAAIVVFMLVKGIQYLRPGELLERPVITEQGTRGGLLDPIAGTLLLTVIGTAIALPLGVATAVWLTEYGRPFWLARAVESGVEVVAGTPSIVLAIFGLLLFSEGVFSWMSFTAEGGAVFGRSFLTAGAMMALIALPLIVGSTREALQSIPRHVREASYALGKTKAATIRRVLLPTARPGIATGTTLGMGRIAGDTAIVIILLGASLQFEEQENGTPAVGGILGTLRGTGSTLTQYTYNNSPAGEGAATDKAYAAAFLLLLIVIGLNFVVDRLTSRRGAPGWTR